MYSASDLTVCCYVWTQVKPKLSTITPIRSTQLFYKSRAHQLSGSKCKTDFIS